MKRRYTFIMILLSVLLTAAVPDACAQKVKKHRQERTEQTTKGKVKGFWGKTKKSVGNAVQNIKDGLGLGDKYKDSLRAMYMPVYKETEYKGDDANSLIQRCRENFYSRYPNAFIRWSSIPQKEWTSVTLKDETGKVKGYSEILYCYVVGIDGNNGAINCEYVFQRNKDVGGTFRQQKDKWPAVTRTDVVPKEVFELIQ